MPLPKHAFTIEAFRGARHVVRANVQPEGASVRLELTAPFGLTMGGLIAREDASLLAVLLWQAAEHARKASPLGREQDPLEPPDALRQAANRFIDHGAL